MSATSKANYQISFPQGPLVDSRGLITGEWQKFFIWLFNRTGSGIGIDGLYLANQGDTNTTNISDIQTVLKELISELIFSTLQSEKLNSDLQSSIKKNEEMFLVNELNKKNILDFSEQIMMLSSLKQSTKEDYENLFVMFLNNQKQDNINNNNIQKNIDNLSNIMNENKSEQDTINSNLSEQISDIENIISVSKSKNNDTDIILKTIEDYSILSIMNNF